MSAFFPNIWHDIKAAAGILTRIPVQLDDAALARRKGQFFWAFPLIGLAVGGIGAGIGMLALAVFPATLAALLSVLVIALITGALHEDGLADCADGFWGGHTPQKRLAIMKDSHIGTYGALALVLGIGLRIAALGSLFASGGWVLVIAIIVFSRTAMLVIMYGLPNARGAGFAHTVGEPDQNQLGIAIGLTALLLLVSLPASLAVLLAAATGCALVAWLAHKKVGGYTGDVLGATQQVTEIFGLLAAVALL